MSLFNFPSVYNNISGMVTAKQIEVTYFAVLGIELAVPFLALIAASIYRKDILENINFGNRQNSYDIHVLRGPEARTRTAKITNIIFYRHRPLLLEIMRICLDITVILYLVGQVRVVTLIAAWCLCDFLLVLHILSLVYVGHTQLSGTAVHLATYITTVYTLSNGFPLGFISKIMTANWLQDVGSFNNIVVPMYIAAVGAFVFTLCYLLPTLCWNASSYGCRGSIGRLQLILLLLFYCAMWMVLYYNISVCRTPSRIRMIPELTQYAFGDGKCSGYFISWTTTFLPLYLILIMALMTLMMAVLKKKLLYRFLPEVVSVWSSSIVFMSLLYTADNGPNRILILPIIAISISIVTTVFVNIILLMDIVSSLREPMIIINLEGGPSGNIGIDETEAQRRKEINREKIQKLKNNHHKTMIRKTFLNRIWKDRGEKICSICLEDFSKNPDPENSSEGSREHNGPTLAFVRKCGHYFHNQCLNQVIECTETVTCPLCRVVIEYEKDDIKLISYDHVKFAFERKNSISTISQVENDKSEKKSRAAITHTHYQPKSDMSERLADQNGTYRIPRPTTSKHCGVCKKFMQQSPKDIVVGYIKDCRHYFHWDCVDRYVLNNAGCPTCDRENGYSHEALETEPDNNYKRSGHQRSGRSATVRNPSNRHQQNENNSQRENSRRRANDRHTVRGTSSHRSRSGSDPRRSDRPSGTTRGRPATMSRAENRSNYRTKPSTSGTHGRSHNRHYKKSSDTVSSRQVNRDDLVCAFLSDLHKNTYKRNWKSTLPSTSSN